MKNKFLALGLFGAAAMANAQTLINPSYDSDIVVGLNNTYDITGPVSIAANAEVVIDRPVFVTQGGSLTIGAGAVLRFQPAQGSLSAGYLCISADGTINASGTATNPIIMTTAANTNRQRWNPGDAFLDATPKTAPLPPSTGGVANLNLWGGLLILGNAPANTGAVDIPDGFTTAVPGYAKIEGVGGENTTRVYYGGVMPNDNSGVLRYVSIRHSGQILAEGDEIQGLTMGGVGAGTTLEYIEIYCSGDDGIEIFGGTANLKYVALSYCDDDGLDLDQGYVGKIQFGLVIASNDPTIKTDNLFEMDGDDDISADQFNVSADGRPFTSPAIYNFTLVGHPNMKTSGAAMRLRQGFGGDIANTLVAYVPSNKGLRIDNTGTNKALAAGYPDARSQERAKAGTLNLFSTSWYGVNDGTVAGIANSAFEQNILTNNTAVTPGAVNNVIGALTVPAFGNNGVYGGVTGTAPFNPVPFAAAVTQNVAPVPAGLTTANYRGAFPRIPAAILWTTGWTALNTSGFLVDNGLNQNLVAP